MIAKLNDQLSGRTEQGIINRKKSQSAYRTRKHTDAVSSGRKIIRRNTVRNRNDQRACGYRSLAFAMIDQAITDYFILVRSGAIKRGKLGDWHTRHQTGRSYGGLYPEDVDGLIRFFEGSCQYVLDLAQANYLATAILNRMRELEDSQRHLEVMRQGTRQSCYCIEDESVYSSEVAHD